MSILDDASKIASNTLGEISNLGHDASAALNKAAQNTQQLAGSFVSAAGQVSGPLGDMFGHDPQEFMHNVSAQFKAPLRELLNRVQERTGKVAYTFNTAKGPRKVSAIVPATLAPNQIALVTCLAALDSPATMAEEAGRMAADLPVKKGLGANSGFTIFPPAASMRGLGLERGVVGIDDALMALLPLLIPIIAQIAGQILPGIIAAAGSIVQSITNPGPTPDQVKAQQAAQAQQQQQQTMMTAGVVIAVIAVTAIGIFLVVRHKKKAA